MRRRRLARRLRELTALTTQGYSTGELSFDQVWDGRALATAGWLVLAGIPVPVPELILG